MFKTTTLMKAVITFIAIVVTIFCVSLTAEFFREATAIAEQIKAYTPLLGIVNFWFIFGIYSCLIAFQFMLFRIFKIVHQIETNQSFSVKTINLLIKVRNAAFALCVCFMIGILPMIYSIAELDDAPGLIIVGFIIGLVPLIVALVAMIIQKVLKEAISYKSDSDLTV